MGGQTFGKDEATQKEDKEETQRSTRVCNNHRPAQRRNEPKQTGRHLLDQKNHQELLEESASFRSKSHRIGTESSFSRLKPTWKLLNFLANSFTEVSSAFSLRAFESARLKEFKNMLSWTLVHNLAFRQENDVIEEIERLRSGLEERHQDCPLPRANKRDVFPEDGGPNNNVILDGFTIPETSLRMVSFVFWASLIPTHPNADSPRFRAVFSSEGRALSPTWQSASTVKCSNLTSTVGRLIPTLHKPLVIFLGDLKRTVDEVLSDVHVEFSDVDLLVHDLVILVVGVGFEDGLSEAVVGGELLQGGPAESLLVLLGPSAPPRRHRSKHLLHEPTRPARASTHAPAEVPTEVSAHLPPLSLHC
nr:Os06g0555101 [Ipomoea trifida]